MIQVFQAIRSHLGKGHLLSGANGVEASPDGRWLYVSKLLTGQNAIPTSVFGCEARHVSCAMGFTVIEVNPNDLSHHQLLRGGDTHFGGGTGAIFVGRTLWVGSFVEIR